MTESSGMIGQKEKIDRWVGGMGWGGGRMQGKPLDGALTSLSRHH